MRALVIDNQEGRFPYVGPADYPALQPRNHTMSVQAISWALDESEASGTDRLVMIVMCHHAEEGYCWASRATLTDETRLSGSTIQRCQERLAKSGEITECGAHNAPKLYLAIPPNRRPRLYELTGFLGSHFADSLRRRSARTAGSSLGGHGVRTGSHATPSELPVSDAIGDRTTDSPAPLADNEKLPDKRCPRCFGYGWFQTAVGDCRRDGAGPVKARCSCTYIVDPILALVEQ